MERLNRLLAGFGPPMPRPTPREALRAAIGAGLGLLVTGAVLWLITPVGALLDHPLLIAPFAASAVLIFAVPNAPLAQPWAVVVGNTVSALCGIAVLRLVPHPLLAAALAVLIAMAVTAQLRALHPPGGATAMAMVLAASPDHLTGWTVAFFPVCLGSAVLMLTGVLWNRGTGRVYPFRIKAPAPHGTADAKPQRRQAPGEMVLAATLDQLRLGANIGVEDLARLIARAESSTAAAALGQITAADLMSRDLVTVPPQTPLLDLARLFQLHGFKSLPVCEADRRFIGLIPIVALVGLSDPLMTARDLIDAAIRDAAPSAQVGDLIDLLADGRQQVVPILDGKKLVGLVTRSDLIALLVHALSHQSTLASDTAPVAK